MREFQIDYLNRYGELIIDEHTNTYTSIKHCKDIKDVKVAVVYALCRPIGKGLKPTQAKRLLIRLNNYFDIDLSREDMRLMYTEFCYVNKLPEFQQFIESGFPMKELKRKMKNKEIRSK